MAPPEYLQGAGGDPRIFTGGGGGGHHKSCHMTPTWHHVVPIDDIWRPPKVAKIMSYDINMTSYMTLVCAGQYHIWCHVDARWHDLWCWSAPPKSLMKRCNVIWHHIWCWLASQKSCMMSCWCHYDVIWCWGRPRSSWNQDPIEIQ